MNTYRIQTTSGVVRVAGNTLNQACAKLDKGVLVLGVTVELLRPAKENQVETDLARVSVCEVYTD